MQTTPIADTKQDELLRSARLSDAIDAMVEIFGFAPARARTVSRRLMDAGSIPRGTYTSAPMVGVRDFITLLVALSADATLRETPAAASDLDALGWAVNGEDVEPDTTAGAFLVGLAELALRGEAWVRQIRIEFIPDSREVEVDFGGGVVERFQGPGAAAANGHLRKSIGITGEGLAIAVERLFGDL